MSNLEIVPFQDLSQFKLKQFYPFITLYLTRNQAIVKEGLNFKHLGIRFEGNTTYYFIKPEFRHLYFKKEIPFTFPFVDVEDIKHRLGLDLSYNYFQKEDLEFYITLQGFTHKYEKGVLHVNYNTNPVVESMVEADSNQLMLFTNKTTDKIDIPLRKGITDIKEVLPTRVTKKVGRKKMGLRVDLTDRFYSVDYLKKLIDLMSKQGGSYILLNILSDNAYVLESKLLNQRSNVRRRNVNYTHSVTKKHYYSNTQLRTVISYAKEKGINIIPEFSILSNVGGIQKLMAIDTVLKEKNWFDGVKGNWLFKEPDAVNFVKNLLDEVNNIFKTNSDYIHCGGRGYEFEYLEQFDHVSYFNEIYIFLKSRGKKMMLWNTTLTNENINTLNKGIEIYYYDLVPSGVTDAQKQKEIQMLKATVPQLLAVGCKVHNANYYYLEYHPKFVRSTIDIDYMSKQCLDRFHLGCWDKDNHENDITTLNNVLGGLIQYSNTNVLDMPENILYRFLENFIATQIAIGLTTNPKDRKFYIEELRKDDYRLCLFDGFIDFWQLAYNNDIYTLNFTGPINRRIRFLNEQEVDVVEDMLTYINGSSNVYLYLSNNWKIGRSEDRNGVTYNRYQYKTSTNVLWIAHEINVIQE